jgi:hypothetical protein
MGFDLGDLTKIPSDEERIAQALSKIEGELKHVDGPDVWSRDDQSPGMLMLLRDCATSAHGVGLALEMAFELGKAAVLGKSDPAALPKFRAAEQARRRGALESRKGLIERSKEWKTVARQMVDANVGRSTDEKITKDICVELDKLRLSRSRRTVFNYVRERRGTTRKGAAGYSRAT